MVAILGADLAHPLRAFAGRQMRRLGVDPLPLASLRHPLGRRRRLLKALHVDLVLDVGANDGEYGSELRGFGYRGQILSFEPLVEPFQRLSHRTHRDRDWHAVQSAIGPSPGQGDINVAGNRGASSSFFPMLQEHVSQAPEASYAGTEEVVIRRLDEASGDAVLSASATFLKADVQGYELMVLESATGILASVVGLQLEMSLTPLYSGAPTFLAVVERARDLGFELVGLEPGFAAADGRLLQADGLFRRSGLRE
jgi:FkbM family methyltransferase